MTSSTKITASLLLDQIIDAWTKLQSTTPLVHCITNSVAANYVANILLAANASPAMIDNPFEAESFAKISGAISINTGTPTAEQTEAMLITAKTAHAHNKPWVLDPVGYSPVLPWRSETVNQLIQFKPTIIRGNASEISTLAGNQVESKGVDSTLDSSDVYKIAKSLLAHTECVAISGETDFIVSKEFDEVIQIHGGSYLQPRVTATGCALGALIAAYSVVTSPALASIAAHVHFSIAGKLAYEREINVGSFNVAFIDQIFSMNEKMFLEHTQLSIID